MRQLTRRRVLQTGAVAGGIALAGCLGDDDDDEEVEAEGYEVWALDQGTDIIYIYEPGEDDGEFDLIEEIDLHDFEDTEPNDDGDISPHMIAYSSDYAYAAIACNFAGQTLIFDTEEHDLIEALDTGAGTHFAGFTPDDDAVIVDVIGESSIVKVDVDNGSFEISDSIAINDDIEGLTEEEGAPICHSYDHNGRSYHTLGPAYGDAGLVVVDHDDFSVDRAYPGDEIPTNCGTMPHPTEDKFYLTAGMPTPVDDDGEPTGDGVGAYYVYDTANDEIIVDGTSTEGIDAHGFWFTPDGEELWVLNRETNDGVIVDPDTDDVIEEIDAYGPETGDEPEDSDAPDIMWASPDGEYLFVSLRGPNPRTGAPHAATGVTSGFSVIDIESRDIDSVIEPDEGNEDSDFHGIGVRPLGDFDGLTSPPF